MMVAWVWGLVVCSILTHNCYLWLGKRVSPDTDILALLLVQERDHVLQRAFTNMVDSAQQRLIVLVGADEWHQARRAADVYQAVLASRPYALQLDHRMVKQNHHEWLARFQQHRLTLLTRPGESA